MKKLYTLSFLSILIASLSFAQTGERMDLDKPVNTDKYAKDGLRVDRASEIIIDRETASERGGGPICGVNEDFESGFPGTWTNVTINATENWEHSATGGNPDGMMSCNYDPNLVLQNETMLTPAIDLTVIPSPTLRFDWLMSYYWGVDPNDNYDLTVSISSDGIIWQELWTEADEGAFDTFTWYTRNIDLSAYSSLNNARFSFNYNGIDGAQGSFDNISVCSAQNDLRVDQVFAGDIINDYQYSQVPVSQSTQVIGGVIYSNAGATTLTNVSVESETVSFVDGLVSAGTIAGPTALAPGESDTTWIATGYTPSQVDTIAQVCTLSADQTDATPLDNEGFQFMLMTDDTWAHDYELEDYFAFGYGPADGTLWASGLEMGAAYFCQTDGSTIYAVDFALGDETTAQSITIKIYENDLASPISTVAYDIMPGDLSTTTVNFINVPLSTPVLMGAGNTYIATIAIESGDGADILGNNLDDGDGGHLLYSANNDTWYNWTGLTTSMRLRVSSVVAVNEDENVSEFTIYPNPASTELTLSLIADVAEEIELNMFDVAGSLIVSQSVQIKEGQRLNQVVNVGELPAGVYAVRVQGESINATRKIIVE